MARPAGSIATRVMVSTVLPRGAYSSAASAEVALRAPMTSSAEWN